VTDNARRDWRIFGLGCVCGACLVVTVVGFFFTATC
jgi:hypothetical protein